jgi:polysaccharide biosynthesis protein PslJ
MRYVTAGPTSGPIAPGVLMLLTGSLATAAVVARPQASLALPLTALVLLVGLAATAHRVLLAWRTSLTVTILVILWIPIRRYELPAALPFDLELYRITIAAVSIAWLASLLIDSRVRLRNSVIDGPLLAVTGVYALSIVFAGDRLNDPGLGATAAKAFVLFAGFVVFFYLIVSVVRRFDEVEFLIRILVGGASVVAFFALLEAWSGKNVFDHLGAVIPVLNLTDFLTGEELARGGRRRVYASAQHPIPLGAMLVMLLPLAVYLAERRRSPRWWLATALLLLAALATLSRTAIVMLLALAVVYWVVRPRDMRRLVSRTWPLIVPAVLAVHFLLPGTLGTFKDLFFAQGALIEQRSDVSVGHGRLASLGPGLEVVAENPVLGLGYGTRIVDSADPLKNSFIVDNGWLSTGMDAGLAALAAWLWLFLRFIRRLRREARIDPSPRGQLLGAFAAAVTAFAVGMLTYDAFSFIQVTLVLIILLALACAAVRSPPVPAAAEPAR